MENRFSVNGLAPHPELNHNMLTEELREKNDTLTREVVFLYGQLYEERLKLSRALGYMREFQRMLFKRCGRPR